MKLGLENSTVLVSASAAGIGLAIAEAFASEGAHVVLNGRTQNELLGAQNNLLQRQPKAKVSILTADLSTVQGAAVAMASWPEVDVLVNNLGVYDDDPFFQATDSQWTRSFDVNVTSAARLARHYLQRMLERRRGRLVFIASEAAIVPVVDLPSYSASKAAQLSLSRSLAELTRGTQVTVNAVIPGSAATAGNLARIALMYPDLDPVVAQQEFMAKNQPSSLLGRLVDPADIAALVVFVCSTQASAINGAALRVDGGILRSIY